MTINQLIIKRLTVSNLKAIELILQKRVLVNGIVARQKQHVSERDSISVDDKEIQIGYTFRYVAFYKPRGIECTLNPGISSNLNKVLSFPERLFPVGRLDKDSEGLLLLTNDGKLYKDIAGDERDKEKEYLVEVDKALSPEMVERLSSGVVIMGKRTRPAMVEPINQYSFKIVLTQGLNRQIRRMCYKLGLEVTKLKRTRIAYICLGNLNPGEFREINKDELDNI